MKSHAAIVAYLLVAAAPASAGTTNPTNAVLTSLPPDAAAGYFFMPEARKELPFGDGWQTYRGPEGWGAVYAPPGAESHVVYGPMLTQWLPLRDVLGPPSSDEADAAGKCRAHNATREQNFGRVSWKHEGHIVSGTWTLCWSATHAWVLPEDAFDQLKVFEAASP
jgi:hypothetical protein